MTKQILLGVMTLGIVVLQVGFFSQVSSLQQFINMYAVVVLVYLLTLRFRQYMLWTLALGLVLDNYSALGFGVITVSLLAAAALGYWLYVHAFSHQANISLVAILLVMNLVYGLGVSAGSVAAYAASISEFYVSLDAQYLLRLLIQSLATGGFVIGLYIVLHPTVERFRQQFLIRRS